jgi:ribonuclease Z
MSNKGDHEQRWRGRKIDVRILYSRAGVAQHIWIESEDGSVLVDAGDGLIRDLVSHRLDPNRIIGVIFTHGHFDHVGGLHSLLGFLRMIGRREELPICAPQGCTEVFSIANNFMKCYSDTIPFQIPYRELLPQEVFKIAGMTIQSYSVIHCGSIEGAGILDPIPALGYRISYKGEIVAITGDTGLCPSLKDLVKGADLAIIEATHHQSEGVNRNVLKRVHLSEDLAKKIGKLAKDFMLVHRSEGG